VAKDVKEVSGSDLSILGFASTEIDRNNKDLIFCSTYMSLLCLARKVKTFCLIVIFDKKLDSVYLTCIKDCYFSFFIPNSDNKKKATIGASHFFRLKPIHYFESLN
jgi:hypothetical protein